MAATKTIPPFYTKLAMVLVSLIALAYIAILGKEILSPMIFGFLFSIVLLPLANFFEKKLKFPRSLAAGVSVILLILSVGIILYILGTQISNLADDWPAFKQQFATAQKGLQHWISARFHVNMRQQMNYLNNQTSNLLSAGSTVVEATVVSLSSVLLFLVFLLIDTFFLLYYRRLIIRFLVAVFREENSITVYDILAEVQSRIRRYIQGLLIEMLIVSAAGCIVLSILGVKYALLLGLLTGLLNLIPYIGIFTSLVISVLVTFATAGLTKIILVVCTLVGIHLIDSNVLMPLIVGSKVRLNALITILGVLIGGSLWGIVGTFLAIPVIAVIKIVFDRIETLKPWGMLMGDEIDEKQPPPLKAVIKKRGAVPAGGKDPSKPIP